MLVRIRLWTGADIDFVAACVEREGWGYSKRDMERCWQFEPDGCIIAEIQDKPVGHVFSICYGKTGWVGLLIVNPENRDKGIGTILMQAAIRYLQKRGAETIRLEAVEKAVPLYKRLGFGEEFDSLRFSKQLAPKEKHKTHKENVFLMQESDIEKIAHFDSKYFGANRLRVLRSLYRESPLNCFVAKEKQRITGYIMSRKIGAVYRIGPWVCAKEKAKAASDLFHRCSGIVKDKEPMFRLGMPALNTNGTKLMEQLGFAFVSKSVRMVWGKPKHKGEILGVYGIGGPEKG